MSCFFIHVNLFSLQNSSFSSRNDCFTVFYKSSNIITQEDLQKTIKARFSVLFIKNTYHYPMRQPSFYSAVFAIIRDEHGGILFQRRQNTGFRDGMYQLPS